jgi:hypothetical protein
MDQSDELLIPPLLPETVSSSQAMGGEECKRERKR